MSMDEGGHRFSRRPRLGRCERDDITAENVSSLVLSEHDQEPKLREINIKDHEPNG